MSPVTDPIDDFDEASEYLQGANEAPRAARTLFTKTSATTFNGATTGAPVTLHTFTLPAGLLAEDGDRILVDYCGDYDAGATSQIGLTFGGAAVATSGPVTDAAGCSYAIRGTFMRVSSSIVEWDINHLVQKYSEAGSDASMLGGPVNDEISGLDLTGAIVMTIRGVSDTENGVNNVRGGAKATFIPAA